MIFITIKTNKKYLFLSRYVHLLDLPNYTWFIIVSSSFKFLFFNIHSTKQWKILSCLVPEIQINNTITFLITCFCIILTTKNIKHIAESCYLLKSSPALCFMSCKLLCLLNSFINYLLNWLECWLRRYCGKFCLIF